MDTTKKHQITPKSPNLAPTCLQLGPNMTPSGGPGGQQKFIKTDLGANMPPTCPPRAPGTPQGTPRPPSKPFRPPPDHPKPPPRDQKMSFPATPDRLKMVTKSHQQSNLKFLILLLLYVVCCVCCLLSAVLARWRVPARMHLLLLLPHSSMVSSSSLYPTMCYNTITPHAAHHVI